MEVTAPSPMPDGRKMELRVQGIDEPLRVRVPEGVSPGDTFEVTVPPGFDAEATFAFRGGHSPLVRNNPGGHAPRGRGGAPSQRAPQRGAPTRRRGAAAGGPQPEMYRPGFAGTTGWRVATAVRVHALFAGIGPGRRITPLHALAGRLGGLGPDAPLAMPLAQQKSLLGGFDEPPAWETDSRPESGLFGSLLQRMVAAPRVPAHWPTAWVKAQRQRPPLTAERRADNERVVAEIRAYWQELEAVGGAIVGDHVNQAALARAELSERAKRVEALVRPNPTLCKAARRDGGNQGTVEQPGVAVTIAGRVHGTGSTKLQRLQVLAEQKCEH